MTQKTNRVNTVLGLDIGIGSVGWALLDLGESRILGMGAHLFDPPQENKTKASLAATRRTARSQRRNTKRSADRNKHCLRVLQAAGLVPDSEGRDWLQMAKGDTQLLQARAEGLDRLLTDRELSQVLFSLSKRRGYIPHGEQDPDAEGRKVLGAIQANAQEMSERRWRTVGEMMYHQGSSRNKAGKYDKCVTNAQLAAEAKLLLGAQRALGNPKATRKLEEAYLECMTWQKDTSDTDERVYERVGCCSIFPNEKRAPKACLTSEMCTAYERVCHVTVVMPDGEERKLPAGLRASSIATLFSPEPLRGNKDCKVRYNDLRKALDLPAGASFKGIDPDKEKSTEVAKPAAWRAMRKALPTELVARMRSDRELADKIGFALTYSSSEHTLRAKLEELGVDSADADAVAELPYSSKLFIGYGNRSLKALDLLVDCFEDVEQVTTLAGAMEATGLAAKTSSGGTRSCKLPAYSLYDPTCTNPVVLRVMGRVRKVVNTVIREYGMPGEIHVELARELKHSAREKAGIAKGNAERREKRESCKSRLAEALGCEPGAVPPKLVRKLELWDQQDGLDLYTGKRIEFERLAGDPTCCDIDHILPYSRTCDDSTTNKVLATVESNREKGNRSPFEWLSEKGTWDEFKARVSTSRKLPYKKRLKLLEQALDDKQDNFIERNLNDTRYASRAAHAYLSDSLAFPDTGKRQHVFAVSGGATSALRGAWGFAGKDRGANDVHHAVDAAVVAACGRAAVIRVAKASETKRLTPKSERAELFAGTEPWQGFAECVEAFAATVIPTRMVDHGGTARLFEDFRYRYDGLREDGKKALLTRSGKTKPYGNYVIAKDGSAMLPDGMAYLRLWWDERTRRYLPEPVYYADLAGIRNGTYIPRVFTGDKPRPQWNALPETATTHHVDLRYGDAIAVNGALARYLSFNSSSGSWILKDPRHFGSEPLVGLSIGSIKRKEDLALVQEDILGNCYRR